MKEVNLTVRTAGGNQGLIDFLPVESIEKPEIKNANPEHQSKVAILF
jgi:hypothetical protein